MIAHFHTNSPRQYMHTYQCFLVTRFKIKCHNILNNFLIKFQTNNMSSSSSSSKPVFKVAVPPGGFLASITWRNTELISNISQDIKVQFLEDSSNGVDFFASSELAIIFITEADLLSDISSCKQRVIKARLNESVKKIVIVQRTMLTADKYKEFQKFCFIEVGVSIIPVNTITEASKLLKQFVHCEMRTESNPFLAKPSTVNSPDETILKTLQSIPEFGDKKALQALEKFTNLKNIVNASEEDLAKVVGKAAAKSGYKYFNGLD